MSDELEFLGEYGVVQRNFDRLGPAVRSLQSTAVQGAEESVRMIRGVVSSVGAVVAGTGFSSARNAAGDYTVTFTAAFGARPSFVAMALTAPAVAREHASTATNGTSYRVSIANSATGAALDSAFNFIAIGPAG